MSYGSNTLVMITVIGFGSWAHHMFASGMSFTEKTVFMVGTLAAVPSSAMHVFNFLGLQCGVDESNLRRHAVWSWGYSAVFASGAGGVVNTAIPLDFLTHDSLRVIGHFHLILMGTISLAFTGFLYYLFPLITGRMYDTKLAKIHFVMAFTEYWWFSVFSTFWDSTACLGEL